MSVDFVAYIMQRISDLFEKIKISPALQLVLVALLFLLSFITFKNIFAQTQSNDYFQEVIAALIGTLLTIILTFFLLNTQTKTEELKEQNVEVFKKRIERYEEMIQLLVEVREDGVVDENEVKQLLKSTYNLALVSNKRTISTLSKYIANITFEDDDDDEVNLLKVIECFRAELKLEGVSSDSGDLEAIREVVHIRQIKLNVWQVAEEVRSRLQEKMSVRVFDRYDFLEPVRIDKAYAFVVESTTSELFYQVILDKDDEMGGQNPDFRIVVGAALDDDGDYKVFPESKVQRITNHAIKCGLESAEQDGKSRFIKDYPTGDRENNTPNSDALSKVAYQIAEDILAVEGFNSDE